MDIKYTTHLAELGWEDAKCISIPEKYYFDLYEVMLSNKCITCAWWNGLRWDSGHKIKNKVIAYRKRKENRTTKN